MNYNKLFLAGVIFLFSASCFYSCKQDEGYKAVITVSRLDKADSTSKRIPVPDCRLFFGQDNFDSEMQREVYTDASGKYTGEWKREASLRIQASKEIDGVMYEGASVIRLTLGGVATQEILITAE